MRRTSLLLAMLLTSAPLSAATAQSFSRDSLYTALKGEWLGTLTYRDYSNDRIVKLPTRVFVEAVGDSALRLGYIYDDGPGKEVRSRESLQVNPSAGTWATQGDRDSAATVTRIAEAEGFTTATVGRIVRLSQIVENDAPAESRDTWTVREDDVTILHETRTPGAAFAMRNELKLRRVSATR